MRAALVQHARCHAVRPDQRGHERHREGRAADLPAGLPELGLSLPAADHRGRQRAPCCSSAFRRKAALELIQRERVTYIATAPASIVAMLNDPELAEFDVGFAARRHHRRRIRRDRDHPRLPGADARASDRALRHAGDRLPHLHALHRRPGQGQRHHRSRRRRAWSCGSSTTPGNDVPHGEIGEIAALGPSVHLGYHANAVSQRRRRSRRMAGSAPAISAAYVDAQGNVEIVGRRKEIINRGGKKFFPREVEEILYTHPEDPARGHGRHRRPRLGERNCLCVIPKPGQTVTLARDDRASSRARWPTTSCRGDASSSRTCRSPPPASCAATCWPSWWPRGWWVPGGEPGGGAAARARPPACVRARLPPVATAQVSLRQSREQKERPFRE